MNISRLNLIQDIMDNAVAKNDIAGLNCVVLQNGKELGYFQSGYADMENKKTFTKDTIVRLYSMTKPVTNVAAWILIENGKMELNEEVAKYLPEYWNLKVCTENGRNGKPYKAYRNILIQDLLNMTSGYTYGAWCEDRPVGEHLTSDFINELNQDIVTENKISTREFAKRMADIPVSFEPGTNYTYGLSADILGALIEVVSGMKFSEFLKKNIFNPLQMNDTDFYVPDNKRDRFARTYDKKGDKLEWFTGCNLGVQGLMDHAPKFESGGAGLCSTLEDYTKFALMLTNKGELNGVRILQEKTVEYFADARLRDNLQNCFNMNMEHFAGYSYCNLMRVCNEPGKAKALTEIGEFGWDGWLGPYVSVDLKNQLTVVLTMQLTNAGTTPTTRKIKNVIYSSL